ncbi:MAG TPA: MFS transporter, partial [Solirubrobacterales bacterium]|nr:MFS transporter [Solirubrobacterales bacterium]
MTPLPALRPLRHRDFRLLWTGLATSLAGDGIWLVALAWQVIELGGGPVELSIVTTAYSVGLIGFVLPGGVAADRLPRRGVMIGADLARAAAVAIAGALSLAGSIELWHLALAGAVIGSGEAFFIPSYTALVPHLLPEEDILPANGLEGTLRPLAQQAVGPAVGGLAVAALEPGAAILLVTATYLFSAGCLAAIHRVSGRSVPDGDPQSPFADLREAAGYVRRTAWLWATLLFAMIAVFFLVGPLDVLVPFAVRDRAGGDSADFGLVLALFGVGSAIGALAISSRPMPRRYLTVMFLAWTVGYVPFAVFGIAEALWVMCAAAFVVGISEAIGMVIWGTLLQRRVPDGLRGRVSGLDFFVSLALTPLSMALAGPAAEAFGLTAV